MREDTLSRLRAARDGTAPPAALLTRLPDGAQRVWPDEALPDPFADSARAALNVDAAAGIEHDGERWFVHPHNPPMRLLVVGAVHIAQALVPMALATGFSVTVIDPRGAFGTAERFAGGGTLLVEWPDDAMAALRPDSRTAVVTLTHDPKLDDPALDAALRSPAFYVGALGSRRTHAKRLARLEELGHGARATARIHAPVGLDIAAVTAPEIAVSILAEVVAARRGSSLSQRRAGIDPGTPGPAPAAIGQRDADPRSPAVPVA